MAVEPNARAIGQGGGGPPGAVTAGANVHDCKLLDGTVGAIAVDRPELTVEAPRELGPNRGSDDPTGREVAASGGHTPQIRRFGEGEAPCDAAAGHTPRR